MTKRLVSVTLLLLLALPLVGFGTAAGFGYKRVVVLTGSMEPTYPVGSMTFVDPLGQDEVSRIQPGDPIMFWSPADFSQTVTHRVAEVLPEGLITRGDANNVDDAWVVPPEAVLGRVIWHIPHIGFATARLQDPATAMVALGGMAVLFILNEIAQIIRAVRTDRRDKRENEAARVVSIRPPDLDATVVMLERRAA